jgi:hypothetical protein
MWFLLVAALLSANKSEVPPDVWACRNQIEIWCTGGQCTAKAEAETTPMDIWARADGAFSVCAYTGCWDGMAETASVNGRLIWAADDVDFLSGRGGFSADVTLVIVEKDGVGFVRVGGFASPVLCLPGEPGTR